MNALFAKGRQKFLEGDIHWLTDTIKAQMIDTADYTVNLDTHEFLSDIPSAARVGAPQTLSGKTSTAGVADAEDTTFPTLSGDSVEALILYKQGASEGASPLIAYIDSGTGLPFTPNGGNVIVQWPSGENRIFKL
jgi:hypothetical protein